MAQRFTDLFPLWAVVLSALAYAVPAPFAAAKDAITPLLGLVMLAMGLTLTGKSFALVLRRPRAVLLGAVAQFVLMPLLAWFVARLLNLPPMLRTGLVLVGACPGGTASNVIAFLAKGDVALSITLTSVSTVFAVFATPLLSLLYLGRTVEVPAMEMLVSVLTMVVLPVGAGAISNTYFDKRLDAVRGLFPVASVAGVVLIIAIIIGLVRDRLATLGASVFAAVVLHNGAGLLTGYGLAKLFRCSPSVCRTIAIEVGMQNSGLGVALATKYFSPLAALPGAIFSIWHNLSGSALASYWSRRETPRNERAI